LSGPLTERVPDESTVRKLTRRIGEQTVNDITRADRGGGSRAALSGACGQDRLDGARGRLKYPTNAGLASHGVKALAREGRKPAAKLRENTTRVRPVAFEGPAVARDLQNDAPPQRGGERPRCSR
jgi:hypothetical protein